MANKTLFQTVAGAILPKTDARNEAGGSAFALPPRHALAQYAVTGCLNATFYAGAEAQLDRILALAGQVDPTFVAKTAIYCRTRGYMKDTPALLCAALATLDMPLLERVFDRVIDDGRTLRNFVQIIRSGVTGRKSLGSAPRRLVRRWLECRDDEGVFRASVGQSPSLADVVKMVHPRPANTQREALYGWLPLVRLFSSRRASKASISTLACLRSSTTLLSYEDLLTEVCSCVPPLTLVALGSFLTSCVGLSNKDAFPVASRPQALSSLQALADQGSGVRPLRVVVGSLPVTAYYVRHPKSRGVLLLFGGSGNEIEAPLKVLGKRTATLRLDLVVFSYYQQGEKRPSVTTVRAEAKAVYAAVQTLPTPAARSVYLLGYSLGGWFALDVAAGANNVRGLALVGAKTTPVEVIHRTDAPWANVVAIRPDADASQLDASRYAPQVRTRALVITSCQDEAVLVAVGQEVFGTLMGSPH